MTEEQFLNGLVFASILIAVGIFISLFFITAPYGRHIRKGWGPSIPNWLSWTLMESPSSLLFALLFIIGTVPKNLPIAAFFILWELHYIHRAFIYPFTIRDGRKLMPVSIMGMGILFNLSNIYINGRTLFTFSGGYSDSWVSDPRFLVGVIVFLCGYGINRWADLALRSLRAPGESGYQIPYHGLFRWVSCPNYLGEIIEWTGWAIATWSLPGLAFAIWTFANLAPRARSHHSWYQKTFREYPPERKALIPLVW